MFARLLATFALFAAALSATFAPASAQTAQTDEGWLFERSDLPLDPDFVIGTLDNGMRYIIRQNDTPADEAQVRLFVDAGSVQENDDERGYAHFVEHMAFNGSERVPEGEMVKLLEREGLAFGADTNASTNFDYTLYKLDLPRADPDLLDTALMLMRETASALTFAPGAVEREKGVVLSERRVRDTYALQNTLDRLEFLYPEAKFAHRIPIGTIDSIENATAEGLKAFWSRNYRPDDVAIVVVGAFDPKVVEEAIHRNFDSWQASDGSVSDDDIGPVDPELQGEADLFLNPALAEKVTISRNGPALDEDDSVATRRSSVLRRIGYGIINRRLQRLARLDEPPFRDAGFGTSDVFDIGLTSNLVIESKTGEWQKGLIAAATEYRRALTYGFTQAEIDEQVANLRTAVENSVASADTRDNSIFTSQALLLVDDEQVPTTPQSGLDRLENVLPDATPENVLVALKEEAVPLDNPLIRFEGPEAPEGGADALRAAWGEAMQAEITPPEDRVATPFGYDSFGPTGTVVFDEREPQLGIRTVRFANGLMLNLKRTDLQRDRIAVEFNLDGGDMLNTRDDPLATAMVGAFHTGGLGQHDYDELQSIMAGHNVGFSLSSDTETFRDNVTTTPRDLELELKLIAAMLTDPGYRPQGEAQYLRGISNFFARLNATPSSAMGNADGAILSDDDPRFSLQPEDDYRALTFEQLRSEIGDRLAHGAIELALVGDFDEDEAIALVAKTLGALPARESTFRAYADNRDRSFTADRSQRILHHTGEADQALIRMVWPTRDDSDLTENLELEMLQRVMGLELMEIMREELGQTYSPGVSAQQSRSYPGYGTFSISGQVDTSQVDAARTAMLTAVNSLISAPVDDDVLKRAREPMLESYDSVLKSNGGWMGYVDRAQTEADRIDRFLAAPDIIRSITPERLREVAAKYLQPDETLEILALPEPDASNAE